MSIENKYELKKGYIGITDPCEPRVLLARGFSEGVKAANEDWIREIGTWRIMGSGPLPVPDKYKALEAK